MLVGGLGTRLGEHTKRHPKPLLPVGGRPFLDYVAATLNHAGIREIVLAAGHHGEEVGEWAAAWDLPARVTVSVEPEPLGTGGALVNLGGLLQERFFVLNGDTILDVEYEALGNLLTRGNADGVVALRRVADTGRYGRATLDDGLILDFSEKSGGGEGLINGGVYTFRRSAIESLECPSSLEADLLPELVGERRLAGLPTDGFFIDIGIPEALASAQKSVPRWFGKPIAFLDKDGVLNVDTGHPHVFEEMQWMPGAEDAVRLLRDKGYRVLVVTNQAGIAKGLYSESEFKALARAMIRRFDARGASIDQVLYCPHHPEGVVAEYSGPCDCRKPGPGMILAGLERFRADPASSFLVGDKDSDLAAAKAAGIRGYLYSGATPLDRFVAGILPS